MPLVLEQKKPVHGSIKRLFIPPVLSINLGMVLVMAVMVMMVATHGCWVIRLRVEDYQLRVFICSLPKCCLIVSKKVFRTT